MRIINLFEKLDSKNIINELARFPGFLEEVDWDNRLSDERKIEIKEQILLRYEEEVKDIAAGKYIPVNSDDGVVIVIQRISDTDLYYEMCKLYKEDFNKAMAFELNKPEEFKNPLVSIMFSKREEVLGCIISKASLDKYGEEVCAAAILREMCFFGLHYEESETKKEEIVQSLVEQAERIESGEEKYYTWDEIRAELGLGEDTRTEEEKKADEEKMIAEITSNINETIIMMKETVKVHGDD